MIDAVRACIEHLHRLGWSLADSASLMAAGCVWLVVCHRGEHRILVRAVEPDDAWHEAVRLALAVEG